MTLLFSKELNSETKEYEVINQKTAEKMGWSRNDLEQGFDGKFYLLGYAPSEPKPTKEEIAQKREQAYIVEVDVLHAQKMRKTVLGTWTEEDEELYIAEVKKRSEDIATRYPYP